MMSVYVSDDDITYKSLGWIASSLGICGDTLCRLVACQIVRVKVNVSMGRFPGYCVEDVVEWMRRENVVTRPQTPYGQHWLEPIWGPYTPTGTGPKRRTTPRKPK
jgi:hypothetical protein